jgi:hypothetical protein
MKVVRLSALRTGHLYPQKNIAGTHFCQKLSRPKGHSAAGRVLNKSTVKYSVPGLKIIKITHCHRTVKYSMPIVKIVAEVILLCYLSELNASG